MTRATNAVTASTIRRMAVSGRSAAIDSRSMRSPALLSRSSPVAVEERRLYGAGDRYRMHVSVIVVVRYVTAEVMAPPTLRTSGWRSGRRHGDQHAHTRPHRVEPGRPTPSRYADRPRPPLQWTGRGWWYRRAQPRRGRLARLPPGPARVPRASRGSGQRRRGGAGRSRRASSVTSCHPSLANRGSARS